MIDAMANRNPAPALVKDGNTILPLFPRDYDWDEQSRVRKAFVAVARNDDPKLWERLVEHFDDHRYALTMCDDGSDAENYSIGHLCRIVAEFRLFFALRQKSNAESAGRPDIYLDVDIKDTAKWRKQNSGKKLYELQIIVCENAIKSLREARDIPRGSKPRIRKELESHISRLKETKKPLSFRVALGGFEFFNAGRAEHIRNRLKDAPKPSRRTTRH